MKFVLYTPWVSPHQIPLARELAKLIGQDEFRFFYTEELTPHQLKWGWDRLINESWIEKVARDDDRLYSCEALFTYVRDSKMIEARSSTKLKTFYACERWFKPIRIGGAEGVALPLPGIVRMWVPRFRKMAKKFVKLVNESDNVRFLPIGPWAKRDFMRIGVKGEKMVPWGYFVAPAENKLEEVVGGGQRKDTVLRVLWVGRMLKLKRVDTLIRAVVRVIKLKSKGKVEQWRGINLTLVGDGPERERLMKLAERVNSAVRLHTSTSPIITFLPSQPADKIREIMRKHDTFVFASDEYEGWGAVVSEALEEGMNVIGTFEAGASAAMLPKERLYHAGDVKELARLLELEAEGRVGERRLPDCSIGGWTAKRAAERLLNMAFYK